MPRGWRGRFRRLGALAVSGLVLTAGCARRGPSAEPERPAPLAGLYQQAEQAPTAERYADVGRAEVARRNWPAAVEAYEQALALDENHLTALAELAGLRLAHGEPEAGERLMARLEKEYPEDPIAQTMLGELYRRLGRRELAVASFQKAARLDPNQFVAQLRLAQNEVELGQLDEAEPRVARLVAMEPDQPEVEALQLELAQRRGRTEEVERLLRETWREERSPRSRALLSSFYLSRSRWRDAIAINEAWLADHPQDGPATIARAEALNRQGDEREAQRSLRELVAAESKDPRVYLALGRLLFDARQQDEAVAMLREALALAPLDSQLTLQAADLFARHDRAADAVDLYRRLATEDPRLRADAAKRVALVAQEADTTDETTAKVIEANYLLALQANPNDVVVLNNLAFHYAHQNEKLAVAKQMIERAIELHGTDANLLDTRGWIAFRQQEYDQARRDLAAAREAAPEDPMVWYHWAELLAATGRQAEAHAAVERALASGDPFIGRAAAVALAERLR